MAFNLQQMMQNMRQQRQQRRGGLERGGFSPRPGGPVNTLPMPGAQPVAQPPMFPTGANPYNPNPYAGGANPYGPQPGMTGLGSTGGMPPQFGNTFAGMAGQPPGTFLSPSMPAPQVQQPYNPFGGGANPYGGTQAPGMPMKSGPNPYSSTTTQNIMGGMPPPSKYGNMPLGPNDVPLGGMPRDMSSYDAYMQNFMLQSNANSMTPGAPQISPMQYGGQMPQPGMPMRPEPNPYSSTTTQNIMGNMPPGMTGIGNFAMQQPQSPQLQQLGGLASANYSTSAAPSAAPSAPPPPVPGGLASVPNAGATPAV